MVNIDGDVRVSYAHNTHPVTMSGRKCLSEMAVKKEKRKRKREEKEFFSYSTYQKENKKRVTPNTTLTPTPSTLNIFLSLLFFSRHKEMTRC